MKLLIFSDSHGGENFLRSALRQHRGSMDAVVFLGDGIRDMLNVLEDFPDLPHWLLAGNCDSRTLISAFSSEIQSEAVFECDGVRFLALHGHTLRVKSGYDAALERASDVGANVVLFGHTHIPENSYLQDPKRPDREILFFNPGSIGASMTHSYGVLYAVDGSISCAHGYAQEE